MPKKSKPSSAPGSASSLNSRLPARTWAKRAVAALIVMGLAAAGIGGVVGRGQGQAEASVSLASAKSPVGRAATSVPEVRPSEALPDDSPALRSFWAQVSGLKGFETGAATAATRLVVLFDPQCIHCANLWQETATAKLPMRVTWIPVGVLGPSSRAQAAYLSDNLHDKAALDTHERRVAAQGPLRGEVPAASAGAKEAVAVHTKLMLDAGVHGVPLMLVQTANNKLRAHEGSMSAEVLRRWAAP